VFQRRLSSSFERRLFAVAMVCAVVVFIAGCAGTVSGLKTTPGALSVSASTFDFKTVVVGQTANQTLTISNGGPSPVQLTGLSLSNKEFTITGPSVPRTILPASSLNYTVSFTPTAAGTASGTLQITSDVSSVPNSVALAGLGQKAFANLVLTPAAINFGSLALQSKSTQNVTMQNAGDINVTIQGITVAGAGFGYSNLSPGFSLAPNQQVTFQVWFSPKTAGAASATVSFVSPNLSSPGTMALSGDGVSSSGGGTPPPAASHSVQLNWNASTSQVIGYRVYRREVSGGSFAPLNGTALNALTYTDTSVSLGTTYYYVVTAVDASGNESAYSNETTAAIPAT
jgi:hypothetical protein